MKKLFLLVAVSAVVLMTSGCGAAYYHARFPVIERPERPKLENISGTEMRKMSPEAQKAVKENFGKLISHSEKLEIAVDKYNGYAVEQNKILDTISPKK
jgi:hypothetical protein